MIYVEENLIERLEALSPHWKNGELNQDELTEFHLIINEIVREARRRRSCFVEPDQSPEEFLLNLIEGRIRKIVRKFINNHKELCYDLWMHYAKQITRTIILGDATRRYDRRKEVKPFIEKFESSIDKHLLLNNKWIKSHHDEMLGQTGPHKKKDFLKSLQSREALDQASEQLMEFSEKDTRSGAGHLGQKSGFLFHDAAALHAAEQGACDIGLGYDPDFDRNELQELLDAESEAEMYVRSWEEGEYRTEFKTKNDLLNWIEDDLIGMPLDTVNKKIKIARKRKSNLLKYLKIFLYRRLKDLNRYINKQNKINAKEFQISSFDSPSQSDSHRKTDLRSIKELYKPQLIPNINESELIEKIDDPDLIQEIKELLQRLLTKKQKQIFQLYYIENHSVSEIAKLLKTSLPNISQIIKRIQPSLPKIKAELSTSKSCDAPVW
jgi:predicted DNA-binding protein YlxM (UPF0122 family)